MQTDLKVNFLLHSNTIRVCYNTNQLAVIEIVLVFTVRRLKQYRHKMCAAEYLNVTANGRESYCCVLKG
jgi:hypothetical protein